MDCWQFSIHLVRRTFSSWFFLLFLLSYCRLLFFPFTFLLLFFLLFLILILIFIHNASFFNFLLFSFFLLRLYFLPVVRISFLFFLCKLLLRLFLNFLFSTHYFPLNIKYYVIPRFSGFWIQIIISFITFSLSSFKIFVQLFILANRIFHIFYFKCCHNQTIFYKR